MEEFVKEIVPRLPLWVLTVVAAAYVAVFIYKGCTSDDMEFLWGLAKFRRDQPVRELLRKSEEDVAILSGLVPFISMLHAELADLFAEANGYHRAGILFPETVHGEQQLGLAWTLSHSTSARKRLKFGLNTIPGRAYTSGEHYYCRDTTQDPNFQPNPYSTHSFRSILCIPIKAYGSVQGVLQIDAVKPNAFTIDDIQTLHAFARYIAVLRQAQALLNCDLEEVAPGEDAHGNRD
ncbi:MAG: putative signaling protein [Firmicutes bacterium]|nr:putative signaling protein [Bacillota bacterium]